MAEGRWPRTDDELREAAESATVLLLIDSAAAYGLVETTIDVGVDRCLRVLERAREREIDLAPTDELIARFLRGANACGASA